MREGREKALDEEARALDRKKVRCVWDAWIAADIALREISSRMTNAEQTENDCDMGASEIAAAYDGMILRARRALERCEEIKKKHGVRI